MGISESMSAKWIVLALSGIANLIAWVKIIKSDEHWILKTIQWLIAMFPVFGWITHNKAFSG